MEDGKKLDGCIPKISHWNITLNDIDWTIRLRDSDMMKFADAILTKEVSIKSNKLVGGQQREGILLQDWCQIYKRVRIIMNEVMAEYLGKELPPRKKDYVEYSDLEWDDLANEMNLIDKMLQNIVIEVELDKPMLEWLERRKAPLNPTQRDTDLASTIYI